MSDTCQHTNPLKHLGTSQKQRFLEALDPAKVELHNLQVSDWMEFAWNYADLLNYYPDDDPEHPDGTWQDFFKEPGDIKAFLDRYNDGDVEPHLTLFVSFLKLLSFPRKSLNDIPRRHLDYFYKEVLQLKKQAFQPDQVHVLFELAKNANNTLVDENISLDAGKDSAGNPLIYKTLHSLVINAAKVSDIRSIFVDVKNRGQDDEKEILRYAPQARSSDGIGGDFKEDKTWSAFGDSAWPEADLCLYIASNLLNLKEGSRKIILDFGRDATFPMNKNEVETYVTGEKKWLNTSSLKNAADPNSNSLGRKWEIRIESDQKAVVGYNESKHKAGLPVDVPVLKIVFTNHTTYKTLKNASFDKLTLTVDVQNVKSLQLSNELGDVDPSNPFMPFGPTPKIGSKLSVWCDELNDKPLKQFSFNMKWLGLPDNFTEHYRYYHTGIDTQVGLNFINLKNNYRFSTKSEIINSVYDLDHTTYDFKVDEVKKTLDDFKQGIGQLISKNIIPADPMKDQYSARVTSPYQRKKVDDHVGYQEQSIKLFDENNTSIDHFKPTYNRATDGSIELALAKSFYHDLYDRVYVSKVVNESRKKSPDLTQDKLPKPPYTPVLDEFSLNYKAESEIDLTASENEGGDGVLFHKYPFGVKKVDKDHNTLVPKFLHKNVYIGLEDTKAEENISLLFQVAEGTENPEHSDFGNGTQVNWHVLSGDDWKELNDKDFARNETHYFLKSGIAEISLPKQADTQHELLDKNKHWLRIKLKKDHPDAVSRFIDIHAQADKAEFINQQNSLDHLANQLAGGTISQLVNRRAAIKSVKQPYASFGGRPAESDAHYYRRVSERLRHKDRAISIWDYEHLVLEYFPDLYKAKCLNHTFWDGENLDEMAPGYVTLVIIPQLPEDHFKYQLKPKVSQNFRDEVERFIREKNSIHADIHAVNPHYEPVQFKFNVQFKDGLDAAFYLNKCEEDLTKLLAPWRFNAAAEIKFDQSFYRYEVINYLENLGYIDYIEDFVMYHKPLNRNFTETNLARPSNPMAILIPAKKQKIKEAKGC